MEQFTIKVLDEGQVCECGLCGEPLEADEGLRLQLADTGHTVCRSCGQRHAPQLVALVDLAQVAERVGRSCRHLLVPPMEVLLALARAAEDYTASQPRLQKRAA